MDFIEATDKLTECPSLAELADELGVAENTVRRARMDPSSPNARTAPSGWEKAVAKLAEKRGRECLKLANELRKEAVTE
jgi:hypothetical protein